MRKMLYFVVTALVALVSCNNGDTDLENGMDGLENTTIKTIEEQIDAINATISTLKDVDSDLKDSINASTTMLSNSITALQNYMESELSGNTDWCNATFATLQQHDSIVQVLCNVTETINTENLRLLNKIDLCIQSTRSWVSKSLIGYYGIAKADAKMASLERRMIVADSVSDKKIDILKEQLDSAKSHLTASYKKAISDAIEINNGVIDGKIAKEVKTINTRIDEEISSINLKLAALEGRIDALLENAEKQLSKKLDIIFSDNEISCSPGDILNINYSVINSKGHASVYTMSDYGWKARVNRFTDSTGVIVVTAPNPVFSGSILTFVNEDDRYFIKSLNFIEGSMSVSDDVLMAEADGDTVSVNIDTDLQYNLVIPQNVDWVHFHDISTRSAMRQETATFYVDENVSSVPRIAIIELKNNNNLIIGSITIRQISNTMQANEIWYTSTNGSVVTPNNANGFGANIVSNIYGNNKGVITFDSDVKRIGYQAFYNKRDLKSLSIPNKVISIDESAFNSCTNLVSIDIPNSVTTIGDGAFSGCRYLGSIDISNSVISIGSQAFSSCSNLININIPNSVKTIGYSAFSNCDNLANINIPNSVLTIGSGAFCYCDNLESIYIPNSLLVIEDRTFEGCSKLKSVTIGSGVVAIKPDAFKGCIILKEIYTKNVPTRISYKAFNQLALSELTLFVPYETKQYYQQLDVWNEFGNIIEVDSIVLKQPEAVDLGLSVKWASFNVGAQSSEQYGSSFAWGEKLIKPIYRMQYYKDSKYGDYKEFIKYSQSNAKTTIEIEDDAANYYMGKKWRIPSTSEFFELINKCDWTWVNINGIYGCKIQSRSNNRSIFLPAISTAGDQIDYYTIHNIEGWYWSNSLYTYNSTINNKAYFLFFSNSNKYNSYTQREYGLPIRAVCP